MTTDNARAIHDFLENKAPKETRDRIGKSTKNTILSCSYPYRKRLDKDEYEDTLEALQIEPAELQAEVLRNGRRIVILFEGRDAAGKGGTIQRFRENLNPRVARVVSLGRPSDREAGQWYFQRYIAHLPTAGEIVFFDSSARIASVRAVLSGVDYRGKIEDVACGPDERICGSPENWDA